MNYLHGCTNAHTSAVKNTALGQADSSYSLKTLKQRISQRNQDK